MTGLNDYQRGYRDAQRRSLESVERQREFGIGAAVTTLKVEMAMPVGCGVQFVTPADGEVHTCTEDTPDLYYTHTDGVVVWNNDGRYEDSKNRVIG